MVGSSIKRFSLLALAVAGVLASADIEHEVRRGFGPGVILPRQVQNLQTFSGALGGAAASPVRFFWTFLLQALLYFCGRDGQLAD